jgi:small subunit ribosomal protein S13
MLTIRILTIPLPAHYTISRALLNFYGLNSKRIKILLKKSNLSSKMILRDLKPKQISRLIYNINYFIYIKRWLIGPKARKFNKNSVQKHIMLKNYIGIRHQNRLPVRGQRTRTNAQTVKRVRA